MSKKIVSAILAATFVVLFAGIASAQERLKATVPFAFAVHGATLPAGTYYINNENGVLLIESTSTRSAAIVLSHPADGRDPKGTEPALVFTPHDGTYVLSQIWEPGGEGLAVASSARSRRATVDNQTSSAPIVVAATIGH